MKKILLLTSLFIFCISIYSQEQNINKEEIASNNAANIERNKKIEELTKEVQAIKSLEKPVKKLPINEDIKTLSNDKTKTKELENIPNKEFAAEKEIDANDEKSQAKPEEIKRPGTSLFELFKLGGVFMWPLLLFSILVFAVIIERAIVFASYKFNIKKTCEPAINYLSKKEFNKAVSVLKENDKCFASELFAKSISFLEKNKIKEFEKHIETSSTVRIAQLEKNQNVLSAMGNIAPLTGFLGTVSGMIAAFKTIALSDNVTARLVAGGIYEALITTAFGLIIAIAAVAANNFFVHKIDNAANEITECANLMVETISE